MVITKSEHTAAEGGTVAHIEAASFLLMSLVCWAPIGTDA